MKEKRTHQPWLEVQRSDRGLDHELPHYRPRGQCGWEANFDAHTRDVIVSDCRRHLFVTVPVRVGAGAYGSLTLRLCSLAGGSHLFNKGWT